MKLLKRLFVLFAVITITACSSDDDSGSGTIQYDLNNTNLSSGAFSMNYQSFTGTSTNPVDGTLITVSSVGEDFNVTYTFFENGTYEINGTYVMVTTLTLTNGDSEIIDIEEVDTEGPETGTYVILDDTHIELDGGDDGPVLTVTLFNANELRMSAAGMEIEDGVEVDYTAEVRMTR